MPESELRTSRPRRAGLWVSVILGALVIIAIADSVAGSRVLVPQGHVLAAQLTEALGRPVEIKGGVRLRLLPKLRFEIMDLQVENLPGRQSPVLASVEFVDLEISFLKLLRLDVEIERLVFRNVHLEIESDEQGHFPLNANPRGLVADDPMLPIDIHLDTIRVENLTGSYRRGKGSEITSFKLDEFQLSADSETSPIELLADGAVRGTDFHFTGELGTVAEVLNSSNPFNVSIRGNAMESNFWMKGQMSSSRKKPYVDLQLHIDIPDLEALVGRVDSRLDAIGAISMEGHLHNPNQLLGLSDLMIRAESRVLKVRITGSIGDLSNIEQVDLAVRFASDDVQRLDPLFKVQLPKVDHFEVNATLSDASGTLGVRGSARAARESGNIAVDVNGGCTDLRELRGIKLNLELTGDDLPSLGEAVNLNVVLPAFAPVKATAVIDDDDGDLGVRGQLSLGRSDGTWATLDADIDDLAEREGVEAKLKFGAANFEAFRAYLGGSDFDLGQFTGEVDLSDADGSLGIERLYISGGKPERLAVRLSGAIDDVLDLDEISLEASFRAPTLKAIGILLGADLPAIGPVAFEGRLSGSNEGIRSNGSILLGETRLLGKWSGSMGSDRRSSLTAVVTSETIRLRDIGIEPVTETPRIIDIVAGAASHWWVGADELPFEKLRTLDFDLELAADRVTGSSGFEITDLTMKATLMHGELRLGPVRARSVGGNVDAFIVLDGSLPTPKVRADFKADGVNLGNLIRQWSATEEYDGIVSVDLHLQGEGQTADELRRSMDGSVNFAIWGATFASKYGKEFLGGLSSVAMPDFNVKKAQRASCLGGAFIVESGVAKTEVLLLESPDVTVIGNGTIDLGRQEYGLQLVPKPRDPGLLSTAATVNVTGSLDSPRFQPVATSLATAAARAFYSNFERFGGMFTSPFRTKRDGDDDLCVTVLGPRPVGVVQP